MPSLQENVAKIAAYYAAQAPEFDEIVGFGSTRREQMFEPLKAMYLQAFKGAKVLELACGTGYWTSILASTAESVLATDVNPELVQLTQQRIASLPNARCQVADAYSLEGITEKFSGAFANFWLSHVPKKMLRPFLDTLHSRLQPGALVQFADHLDTAGYRSLASSGRRVDEHGDVYEERRLSDGRHFETIKNFPEETELRAHLEEIADEITYTEVSSLWVLFYRVKSKQ